MSQKKWEGEVRKRQGSIQILPSSVINWEKSKVQKNPPTQEHTQTLPVEQVNPSVFSTPATC